MVAKFRVNLRHLASKTLMNRKTAEHNFCIITSLIFSLQAALSKFKNQIHTSYILLFNNMMKCKEKFKCISITRNKEKERSYKSTAN